MGLADQAADMGPQEIGATMEALCVEFGEVDGVASMMNGSDLLSQLNSFGLQLAGFKTSPHFRVFKAEMRSLQLNLRPLEDLVDILMKVRDRQPPNRAVSV